MAFKKRSHKPKAGRAVVQNLLRDLQTPQIALLFLISIVFTLNSFTFLTGDDAYQVALAFLNNDDSLYAKDVMIQEQAAIYPKYFIAILSTMLKLPVSSEQVFLLAVLALKLIFVLGAYTLSKEVFGDSKLAFLSGLFANFHILVPGSISLAVDSFIPRNIVLALLPWLLLFFLKSESNQKRVILLFVTLGLITNLNPIATFPITGAILFYLWFENRDSKQLLLYTSVYLLLLMPYLMQSSSIISLDEGRTEDFYEIVRERNRYMYTAGYNFAPDYLRNNLLVSFSIIGFFTSLIFLSFYYRRWKDKFFIVFAISIFLYYLTSLIPGDTVFRLFLQTQRSLIYVYFLVFIFLPYLIQRFSQKSRMAFFAFLALLIVGFSIFSLSNEVNSLYRQCESKDIPFCAQVLETKPLYCRFTFSVFSICRQETPSKGLQESYLQINKFISGNTKKDALILDLTRSPELTRVYGKRGIVVSYKDGTFGVLSPRYASIWKPRMDDLNRVLGTKDWQLAIEVAKKYGADHILVETHDFMAPSLPLVAETDFHTLYGIGS